MGQGSGSHQHHDASRPSQPQHTLPPDAHDSSARTSEVATVHQGALDRYFPIHDFVVEAIQATTHQGKGGRWNQSFSPLQVGKAWFYTQLGQLAPVHTLPGYATKALRDDLGLKKSRARSSDRFAAHGVDAWVLANHSVGGHTKLGVLDPRATLEAEAARWAITFADTTLARLKTMQLPTVKAQRDDREHPCVVRRRVYRRRNFQRAP